MPHRLFHPPPRSGSPSAPLLAGLLTVTGTLHFLTPRPFVAIVPRSLPAPELLVAVSGIAELAAAGLLACPPTRRLGGLVATATFLAVFPANVSMACRSRRRPVWYRALVWARLPLQWPLIAVAWRLTRASSDRRPG